MDGARDMAILLCPDLGRRLDIWKLNDKLIGSGNMNG
jgi:hypothetical protein